MEMEQFYIVHIHVTVTGAGKTIRRAQYLVGPYGTKEQAEYDRNVWIFEKGIVPEVVRETKNVYYE